MRMYPAYTLRDVLDEYAITFYALLNEGYRQMHERYLILSQISDLPYMDEDTRARFYNDLNFATIHPSDILKPSGEGSSPAEIKKTLGG